MNWYLVSIAAFLTLILILSRWGHGMRLEEQWRMAQEVEARKQLAPLLEGYIRTGWIAAGNEWRAENHEDTEKIVRGLIRLARRAYCRARFPGWERSEAQS